jgi:hypothetical protein
LDGDDTAERSRAGWVLAPDQADIILASDGAGAGLVSCDGSVQWLEE